MTKSFTNLKNLGFIGLGRMGNLMAKNLIKRGYLLNVWNRTIEKAKELSSLGASIAENPKAVAEKSDVIICMLANPLVTEDVILGKEKYIGISVSDGISKDKMVIDMSTNNPKVVKRMANTLKDKGCELIDAPVMGSINLAAEGGLTILASGREESVNFVKPILEAMGKKVWYIGEVGLASSLKLILNTHLWIMLGAFCETLTLAAKVGIDTKLMLEVLNSSPLKTFVSETKAKKVLERDWRPAATLEIALKDLNLAVDMAEEAYVPIPLANLIKDLFIAGIAKGLKDLDYSALICLYESLAKVKVS
ncbi:MAG: NAD(P)-dependent oxidoreductase [Nitrososphaerales archaeon]